MIPTSALRTYRTVPWFRLRGVRTTPLLTSACGSNRGDRPFHGCKWPRLWVSVCISYGRINAFWVMQCSISNPDMESKGLVGCMNDWWARHQSIPPYGAYSAEDISMMSPSNGIACTHFRNYLSIHDTKSNIRWTSNSQQPYWSFAYFQTSMHQQLWRA